MGIPMLAAEQVLRPGDFGRRTLGHGGKLGGEEKEGVRLKNFPKRLAETGEAPAGWSFDQADWWLEEHGLIMEQPEALPPGKYEVTGDREVTTTLTIYPKERERRQQRPATMGIGQWSQTLRCDAFALPLRALHGRPLLARGGAAERLPGDAGGGDAAGGAVPEDAWTKGEGMFQQVPSAKAPHALRHVRAAASFAEERKPKLEAVSSPVKGRNDEAQQEPVVSGAVEASPRAEAVEAGPQGRCWVSRVKDDDHLFLFQTLVFESANIIIRWASTRMNLASSNRSVRGSEREGDLVGSAWLGHKPYFFSTCLPRLLRWKVQDYHPDHVQQKQRPQVHSPDHSRLPPQVQDSPPDHVQFSPPDHVQHLPVERPQVHDGRPGPPGPQVWDGRPEVQEPPRPQVQEPPRPQVWDVRPEVQEPPRPQVRLLEVLDLQLFQPRQSQVAREELQPHDEEIFEKERCRAWLVFVPPLGGGPSIHLRNTEAFPLARW
eukprot:g33327.t2